MRGDTREGEIGIVARYILTTSATRLPTTMVRIRQTISGVAVVRTVEIMPRHIQPTITVVIAMTGVARERDSPVLWVTRTSMVRVT